MIQLLNFVSSPKYAEYIKRLNNRTREVQNLTHNRNIDMILANEFIYEVYSRCVIGLIDRANDVCEEDTAEEILKDFTERFDEIREKYNKRKGI